MLTYGKLITQVVIATWPDLPVLGFYSYLLPSDAYLTKVRAAAKILMGLWGALESFTANFTSRVTGPSTNYFSEDI